MKLYYISFFELWYNLSMLKYFKNLLAQEVIKMNSNSAWKKFTSTGNIYDYLSYRNELNNNDENILNCFDVTGGNKKLENENNFFNRSNNKRKRFE